MTKQQAVELAARLERIWDFEGVEWTIAPSPPVEGIEGFLCLKARLSSSLLLSVEGYYQGPFTFYLDDQEREHGLTFGEEGQLDQSSFSYEESPERAGIQAQFEQHCLPFFRRGCWLSGCSIDASMHEKVEWMQGFTKEEVEAWKLKM